MNFRKPPSPSVVSRRTAGYALAIVLALCTVAGPAAAQDKKGGGWSRSCFNTCATCVALPTSLATLCCGAFWIPMALLCEAPFPTPQGSAANATPPPDTRSASAAPAPRQAAALMAY